MSENKEHYQSYSEYKRAKKKKNDDLLKLILLGIIGISSIIIAIFLFLEIKNWLFPTTLKENIIQHDSINLDNSREPSEEQYESRAVTLSCKNLTDDKFFGKAKYLIHIHKDKYILELFTKSNKKPMRVYECAIAKNNGDKTKSGDNKTPSSWGTVVSAYKKYSGANRKVPSWNVPFRVEEICNASTWTHDFGDGKGVIKNAYGPWFISLDTGWDGIGIHGTHDESSIARKNVSEGCIRLKNKDIEELKNIIYTDNKGVGTGVIILESSK